MTQNHSIKIHTRMKNSKKFLCYGTAVVLSSKKLLFIEGKITRPNFFYLINFSVSGKLFALAILRVEFGHFYSG
jgi:hypothetical protein